MTWVTILIGGLSGLAALLGVILGRRQQVAVTDKTRAEAAAVIQDTALELLDPLRKRIAEVEAEVVAIRTELRIERLWRQRSNDALRQGSLPVPPRPDVGDVGII